MLCLLIKFKKFSKSHELSSFEMQLGILYCLKNGEHCKFLLSESFLFMWSKIDCRLKPGINYYGYSVLFYFFDDHSIEQNHLNYLLKVLSES